jgi:hypothetical protein
MIGNRTADASLFRAAYRQAEVVWNQRKVPLFSSIQKLTCWLVWSRLGPFRPLDVPVLFPDFGPRSPALR